MLARPGTVRGTGVRRRRPVHHRARLADAGRTPSPRPRRRSRRRSSRCRRKSSEQAPQDPFDMFFGRAQPRTQAGLGTGFIVREDGVIVTNAHVVAGATSISVMLRDGTIYPGQAARHRRDERPRRAQDRREEPAGRAARQLRRPDDRRVGDRDRQSVRLLCSATPSRASRRA